MNDNDKLTDHALWLQSQALSKDPGTMSDYAAIGWLVSNAWYGHTPTDGLPDFVEPLAEGPLGPRYDKAYREVWARLSDEARYLVAQLVLHVGKTRGRTDNARHQLSLLMGETRTRGAGFDPEGVDAATEARYARYRADATRYGKAYRKVCCEYPELNPDSDEFWAKLQEKLTTETEL